MNVLALFISFLLLLTAVSCEDPEDHSETESDTPRQKRHLFESFFGLDNEADPNSLVKTFLGHSRQRYYDDDTAEMYNYRFPIREEATTYSQPSFIVPAKNVMTKPNAAKLFRNSKKEAVDHHVTIDVLPFEERYHIFNDRVMNINDANAAYASMSLPYFERQFVFKPGAQKRGKILKKQGNPKHDNNAQKPAENTFSSSDRSRFAIEQNASGTKKTSDEDNVAEDSRFVQYYTRPETSNYYQNVGTFQNSYRPDRPSTFPRTYQRLGQDPKYTYNTTYAHFERTYSPNAETSPNSNQQAFTKQWHTFLDNAFKNRGADNFFQEKKFNRPANLHRDYTSDRFAQNRSNSREPVRLKFEQYAYTQRVSDNSPSAAHSPNFEALDNPKPSPIWVTHAGEADGNRQRIITSEQFHANPFSQSEFRAQGAAQKQNFVAVNDPKPSPIWATPAEKSDYNRQQITTSQYFLANPFLQNQFRGSSDSHGATQNANFEAVNEPRPSPIWATPTEKADDNRQPNITPEHFLANPFLQNQFRGSSDSHGATQNANFEAINEPRPSPIRATPTEKADDNRQPNITPEHFLANPFLQNQFRGSSDSPGATQNANFEAVNDPRPSPIWATPTAKADDTRQPNITPERFLANPFLQGKFTVPVKVSTTPSPLHVEPIPLNSRQMNQAYWPNWIRFNSLPHYNEPNFLAGFKKTSEDDPDFDIDVRFSNADETTDKQVTFTISPGHEGISHSKKKNLQTQWDAGNRRRIHIQRPENTGEVGTQTDNRRKAYGNHEESDHLPGNEASATKIEIRPINRTNFGNETKRKQANRDGSQNSDASTSMSVDQVQLLYQAVKAIDFDENSVPSNVENEAKKIETSTVTSTTPRTRRRRPTPNRGRVGKPQENGNSNRNPNRRIRVRLNNTRTDNEGPKSVRIGGTTRKPFRGTKKFNNSDSGDLVSFMPSRNQDKFVIHGEQNASKKPVGRPTPTEAPYTSATLKYTTQSSNALFTSGTEAPPSEPLSLRSGILFTSATDGPTYSSTEKSIIFNAPASTKPAKSDVVYDTVKTKPVTPLSEKPRQESTTETTTQTRRTNRRRRPPPTARPHIRRPPIRYRTAKPPVQNDTEISERLLNNNAENHDRSSIHTDTAPAEDPTPQSVETIIRRVQMSFASTRPSGLTTESISAAIPSEDPLLNKTSTRKIVQPRIRKPISNVRSQSEKPIPSLRRRIKKPLLSVRLENETTASPVGLRIKKPESSINDVQTGKPLPFVRPRIRRPKPTIKPLTEKPLLSVRLENETTASPVGRRIKKPESSINDVQTGKPLPFLRPRIRRPRPTINHLTEKPLLSVSLENETTASQVGLRINKPESSINDVQTGKPLPFLRPRIRRPRPTINHLTEKPLLSVSLENETTASQVGLRINKPESSINDVQTGKPLPFLRPRIRRPKPTIKPLTEEPLLPVRLENETTASPVGLRIKKPESSINDVQTEKPLPFLRPRIRRPKPTIKPLTKKPVPSVRPRIRDPVASIKPRTDEQVPSLRPRIRRPRPQFLSTANETRVQATKQPVTTANPETRIDLLSRKPAAREPFHPESAHMTNTQPSSSPDIDNMTLSNNSNLTGAPSKKIEVIEFYNMTAHNAQQYGFISPADLSQDELLNLLDDDYENDDVTEDSFDTAAPESVEDELASPTPYIEEVTTHVNNVDIPKVPPQFLNRGKGVLYEDGIFKIIKLLKHKGRQPPKIEAGDFLKPALGNEAATKPTVKKVESVERRRYDKKSLRDREVSINSGRRNNLRSTSTTQKPGNDQRNQNSVKSSANKNTHRFTNRRKKFGTENEATYHRDGSKEVTSEKPDTTPTEKPIEIGTISIEEITMPKPIILGSRRFKLPIRSKKARNNTPKRSLNVPGESVNGESADKKETPRAEREEQTAEGEAVSRETSPAISSGTLTVVEQDESYQMDAGDEEEITDDDWEYETEPEIQVIPTSTEETLFEPIQNRYSGIPYNLYNYDEDYAEEDQTTAKQSLFTTDSPLLFIAQLPGIRSPQATDTPYINEKDDKTDADAYDQEQEVPQITTYRPDFHTEPTNFANRQPERYSPQIIMEEEHTVNLETVGGDEEKSEPRKEGRVDHNRRIRIKRPKVSSSASESNASDQLENKGNTNRRIRIRLQKDPDRDEVNVDQKLHNRNRRIKIKRPGSVILYNPSGRNQFGESLDGSDEAKLQNEENNSGREAGSEAEKTGEGTTESYRLQSTTTTTTRRPLYSRRNRNRPVKSEQNNETQNIKPDVPEETDSDGEQESSVIGKQSETYHRKKDGDISGNVQVSNNRRRPNSEIYIRRYGRYRNLLTTTTKPIIEETHTDEQDDTEPAVQPRNDSHAAVARNQNEKPEDENVDADISYDRPQTLGQGRRVGRPNFRTLNSRFRNRQQVSTLNEEESHDTSDNSDQHPTEDQITNVDLQSPNGLNRNADESINGATTEGTARKIKKPNTRIYSRLRGRLVTPHTEDQLNKGDEREDNNDESQATKELPNHGSAVNEETRNVDDNKNEENSGSVGQVLNRRKFRRPSAGIRRFRERSRPLRKQPIVERDNDQDDNIKKAETSDDINLHDVERQQYEEHEATPEKHSGNFEQRVNNNGRVRRPNYNIYNSRFRHTPLRSRSRGTDSRSDNNNEAKTQELTEPVSTSSREENYNQNRDTESENEDQGDKQLTVTEYDSSIGRIKEPNLKRYRSRFRNNLLRSQPKEVASDSRDNNRDHVQENYESNDTDLKDKDSKGETQSPDEIVNQDSEEFHGSSANGRRNIRPKSFINNSKLRYRPPTPQSTETTSDARSIGKGEIQETEDTSSGDLEEQDHIESQEAESAERGNKYEEISDTHQYGSTTRNINRPNWVPYISRFTSDPLRPTAAEEISNSEISGDKETEETNEASSQDYIKNVDDESINGDESEETPDPHEYSSTRRSIKRPNPALYAPRSGFFISRRIKPEASTDNTAKLNDDENISNPPTLRRVNHIRPQTTDRAILEEEILEEEVIEDQTTPIPTTAETSRPVPDLYSRFRRPRPKLPMRPKVQVENRAKHIKHNTDRKSVNNQNGGNLGGEHEERRNNLRRRFRFSKRPEHLRDYSKGDEGQIVREFDSDFGRRLA